jgi:Ca-activated chloride channel family protein
VAVLLFLLETEGWYRPEWFLPSTWREYVWKNPFWLYVIPFLILLPFLRWLLALPLQQKLEVVLPKKVAPFQKNVWLRFVPDVVLLLSLSLICVALARPQKVNEKIEKYSEGIDMVFALDVSESMSYEDYQPNRLQVAIQTAQNFISGRLYEDRIGLVVFSGEAFTLMPLTTDYDLLKQYLSQEVQAKMTESEGTALGDALAVSINRLEKSNAKSKVIILLSDGDNNAGRVQPLEAAQIAKEKQIKVYSIVVASRQEQVPYGKDANGKPVFYENAIDESIMQQIATITKGEFFRADDPSTLQKIFDKISQYEKSEILEVKYVQSKDYYRIYLIWAVILWLFWLLLKTTFMNNALED